MKIQTCWLLCCLAALAGCHEGETPDDSTTGVGGESEVGGGDEGGNGGEDSTTSTGGAGGEGGGGGGGGGETLCTPTAKQCSGLNVETCSDDGESWGLTATCPFLCEDGACVGECAPGSNQCNGDNVETCDAAASWQMTSTCTFVCIDGACGGECEPGATKCDGLVPQTCNDDGEWVDGSACPFTCSQGTCTGACSPGATACNGDVVQTCDANGQWQNTTDCPFVCSSGSCTGVCVPGAQQCSGDAPQTCNASGQWVTGSNCPFLCTAGACTGVCEPGSKKCTGTGTQTCNALGQWDAMVACPSPNNSDPVCIGNGVCGWDCEVGFDDCNGNPADGCEANLASPDTCGSCGNVCNEDGGTATCSMDSCGIVCDSAHSNCNGSPSDGCEITLGTTNNCETCGDVCTAPAHATGVCEPGGCDFICSGLWDDCNGNPADGCEQDVSDDDFNCGGCGISCYGGTCTNGVCSVPVEKVASASGVTSMALGTPVGVSAVFWTTSGGKVQKAPTTGGVAADLAIGQTGPEGIVVSNSQVVWSNSVAPKAIRSMPIGGGAPTDLITGHGPVELTHDGTSLFWTSRMDYNPCNCSDSSTTPIYKMGLGGGAATIINPEVNSGLYPSWPGLVVDGTNVYRLTWETNSAVSVIRSQNKTDPTVYGGAGGGIYVNSTFEFFTSGRYMAKNPQNDIVIWTTLTTSGPALVRAHDGQSPSLIALTPSLEVKSVTADNTHVYVIGRFGISLPYWVIRYPLSGGVAEYLVENQHNAGNLQVDATHVYWTIEGVKYGLAAPVLDPTVVRMAK